MRRGRRRRSGVLAPLLRTIDELKHRHPDDAIQHHVNLRLGLCVTCEISQLKRVMPTLNLRRS